MAHVSEEMVTAFEADGVILLRNVFSEAQLDRLAVAVDEIMSAPRPLSRDYVQGGEGRFFTDHHMSRHNDIFRDFMPSS